MTVKDVLKTRAKALARPAAASQDAGQTLKVVEFRLAWEHYAIEQAFVREVIALKELTPLPCTPAFVRGVVNVRGQIVPVIDIKRFFDLPETGIADVHRIIIVHSEGIELGIEADAVTGIRAIPLAKIQQSLPTLTGIRPHQYLKGIADDHVVVLDAARILADPKILVDEEVHPLTTTEKKP